MFNYRSINHQLSTFSIRPVSSSSASDGSISVSGLHYIHHDSTVPSHIQDAFERGDISGSLAAAGFYASEPISYSAAPADPASFSSIDDLSVLINTSANSITS